jgi:pimeloyl-ACP methyl ester carboxylesterase
MPDVILLHGLGSPGWSMALIARRLRTAGLRPHVLAYSGWSASIDEIVDGLLQEIEGLRLDSGADVLGHSLGGLVARRLAERGRDAIGAEKLVMVGTPLLGNSFASFADRSGLGRLAFRKVWRDLVPSACARNHERIDGVRIGMIAGATPGSAMLYGSPSDGVVSVQRTMGRSLDCHVVVPASHASLLVSNAAARHAVTFLRTGAFERGPSSAK